jgi:hypothetical protein
MGRHQAAEKLEQWQSILNLTLPLPILSGGGMRTGSSQLISPFVAAFMTGIKNLPVVLG